MNIESRRYGKLKVSKEVVQKFWDNIKGIIIPIRIEYVLSNSVFEIEAYCEAFKELKEGDTIPTYNAIFKRSEDGAVIFEGFEEISI